MISSFDRRAKNETQIR